VAVGSGAIRAGRAFVELFADSNALYRALDKAQARVLKFASFVAKVGVGVGGLGGAVLAPLTKLFTEAMERGRDLNLLGNRLGIGTEALGDLAAAATVAGVSLDELGGTLESLSTRISHAADKNDELVEGIAGLRGRDLLGKGIDQQLDQIAERIKKIGEENPADQLRIANDLGLGKLLPWLKRGKEGMDEFRKSGREALGGLDPETARQSAEVMRQWTLTVTAAKNAALSLGFALLPPVDTLKEWAASIRTGLGQAREWVATNKGAIVTVAAVAAGLVVAGTGLVAVATGAVLAAKGVLLVVAGVKLLAGAVLFLTSPIGLVTAAVIGLTILFVRYTETGRAMFAFYKGGFDGLVDTAKTAFAGISDAVSAGDFSLAFKIGVAAVEVEWAKLVETLTMALVGFKYVFLDTFRDAVAGFKLMFIDLAAFFLKVTVGMVTDSLTRLLPIIRRFDKKLANDLSNLPGLMSSEQIEQGRGARDDILNDRQRQQEESDRERGGDIGGARGAREQAEKEFRDLREQAASEARAAKWAAFAGGIGKAASGLGAVPKGPDLGAVFSSVRGAVTGGGPSLAQQVGYGDQTSNRILNASEKTADGVVELTKEQAKTTAAVAALATALTFG
jgi:hypothetical protein